MSDNGRAGAISRGTKTVLAVALIAAMVLAVPVMVSFDSDAEITDGEAGYSIKMVNPTDDEIATYGIGPKAWDIVTEARYVTYIFNTTQYGGNYTVTSDTYESKFAEGLKQCSDYFENVNTECMKAEGVTITFTATSSGDLLKDEDYEPDDVKAAIEAVKDHFGNDVDIGDELRFTGKIKTEFSAKVKTDLAKVTDGQNVVTGIGIEQYYVTDIDVTIAFTHEGKTKTISATSDFKFMLERSAEYDFHGTEYSQITPSTSCTVKYGPDKYSFRTGDIDYKVGDKDCSIDYAFTPRADHDTYATILTDVQLNTALNNMKSDAAAYPSGTANVTVDREFSDAESAYADVMVDVVGDDLMKILMIIGGVVLGVIALIVIAIIVIVVVMRKKRQSA